MNTERKVVLLGNDRGHEQLPEVNRNGISGEDTPLLAAGSFIERYLINAL
jgi:hypothetical protein